MLAVINWCFELQNNVKSANPNRGVNFVRAAAMLNRAVTHALDAIQAGLFTWSIPAAVNWSFLPYALLGLSLPGGVRLVTWTIPAVIN
jgi:hypothetical protein